MHKKYDGRTQKNYLSYLVGDARISHFLFVFRDVEEVLFGGVLPELGRALAGELADGAAELARAPRPLFERDPEI